LIKKTNILIVILFVLITKSYIYAQTPYSFSDAWGVGANIGLNYFYGDVNDDKGRIWNNTPLSGFYYTDKNIMGSLHFTKDINKLWGFRGNFTFGNLSGSNEKTNMYFKGTLYAFDIDVSFQYLDYFLKRPPSNKFKYYAFAGLGFCSYNAIRRDATTQLFQGGLGYDIKGKTTHFAMSSMEKIGLGIAYHLDKVWVFNFETSLNYLNTDDLDAYASSSSRLEGFGFLSFGVIYKFDFNFNFETHNGNKLWEKSRGSNNRTFNSGLYNKKKKKLHNKWKR